MSVSSRQGAANQLAVDRDAEMLAESMIRAEGVHRAILEETVDSARAGTLKEAGRTACGSLDDVRIPFRRFPTAVELAECPIGVGAGIWHTHVSREQFRNPTHSLPDWGNVVFGHVDVSAVVGTQSIEVVMAPTDLAAMQAGFREAMGVEVFSKRGIIAAIISDTVDPEAARARVKQRLGPLVRRHTVSFSDIDASAGVIPTEDELRDAIAVSHPSIPMTALYCSELADAASPDIAGLRQQSRMARAAVGDILMRFGDEAITQAIGVAVGQAIAGLFD